jgi:hypothetical protein
MGRSQEVAPVLSPLLLVGLLVVAVAVHVALQRSGPDEPVSWQDGVRRLSALRGRWRRSAQARRARRLPPRPVADRPPAGLTPLLASPRVVALEVTRGVRELEDWLAEQDAA